MIQISIVICTYNRATFLSQVLDGLMKQSCDKEIFEVLVIDNNSTDNTSETVNEYAKNNPQIKYFFEPVQGLSTARNRGYKEANGVYVGYTDDDCRIPPDWLKNAIQVINLFKPDVFGGPILPFYQIQKPGWYKDDYAAINHGKETKYFSGVECLSGGNMFFRKDLLIEADGFDVKIGMNGRSLGYAEEDSAQLRIRKKNPKARIYYDPQLFVFHYVSPLKMSLLFSLKAGFQIGASKEYLYQSLNIKNHDEYKSITLLFLFLISIILLIKELLKGIIFRDKDKYPSLKNLFYEKFFKYSRMWGNYFQRCKRVETAL